MKINLRNYGSNDDPRNLLSDQFSYEVYQLLIHILMTDKKIPEDKAVDIVDELFRNNKVPATIKNNFSNEMTKEECAKNILEKYYKITKINNFSTYLNQEEVTGVNENTQTQTETTTKKEKEFDSSISNKNTSPIIFWIFVNKIYNLKLQFLLDTVHFKNKENSLNNNFFNIYMKTDKIKVDDIEYDFKHSRILAYFLKFLDLEEEIEFFIGIKLNKIYYGFVKDEKNYQLGLMEYSNTDIYKLDNYIKKTNTDIDLKILANKFRSNLNEIYHVLQSINYYLENYDEVKYVYITIIDNKFYIVVETEDSDILSVQYLTDKIKSNTYYRNRLKFNIEKSSKENKDFYLISIIS